MSSSERQATPPADQKGEGPEVEEGPLDVSYVGVSTRNIVTTVTNPDPSCLYYEQYCIDEDFFRLGMLCGGRGCVSCDCHATHQVTLCTCGRTRRNPSSHASTRCGRTRSKIHLVHCREVVILQSLWHLYS